MVNGQTIPCVIDTGAMVTMFTQSMFNRYFGDDLIQDKADIPWLILKAANGLEIPYVGYAVLDFAVGGIDILAKGVMIVKDGCMSNDYGLLGMNVINECWAGLFQGGHPGEQAFKSLVPPAAGKEWEKAFAICRRAQVPLAETMTHGTAKLPRQAPIWIPAESEMVVWATVPQALAGQSQLMVEDLSESGDEGRGWRVARALCRAQGGKVPLRICNPNPSPVLLPQRRALATVSSVDSQSVRGRNRLVLTSTDPQVIEVDVRPVTEAPPARDHPALSLEGEGLTHEQQQQLQDLMRDWVDVFAAHDEDFGCTGVVHHQIPTGTAPPIRERYRPVPPSLYTELRELLKGMLDTGVITESSSPWAAPVVLVRKKDGSWRFCVDYRKLNAVTHKDAFPLPRIEEALTGLKQAKWYSTLDLASGYWQVEVAPADQEKTAFTTPVGLYQFSRMPFGLCNAPATFQRLMQRCLGGQVHDHLLIYLDDVIVYSADFQGHLDHLTGVFQRLREHGLKLQPTKCHLFQQSVKYLGHVVSAQGVSPDPEKTAAVQEWPVPKTVKQVRSFLGFVGYYRRFIKAFSKIAGPLTNLLQGTSGRSSAPVSWTDPCQSAFDRLKQALLTAPVLAFADFAKPFRLYTDASLEGLGAVLSQTQDGKERVIAYASRRLLPTERNDQNYSSFKIELLALKWAVTEKFKDYLWGASFTIVTDNNPLVHLDTARLGAVEQRWAAQLANYTFDIKYRPGTANRNADLLSRLPEIQCAAVQVDGEPASPTSEPEMAVEEELPGNPAEPVAMTWAQRRPETQCAAVQADGGPASPTSEPEMAVEEELPGNPAEPVVTIWAQRQQHDPDLHQVYMWLESGEPPPTGIQRQSFPGLYGLLREWDRLRIREGVLVREMVEPDTQTPVHQVMVPMDEAQAVWQEYHRAAGHSGAEKVLSILRRRFFWPGMSKTVQTWTRECPTCVLSKRGLEPRAPLKPIQSSYPFEIVGLDYLSLGRPADTYPYILVITDLFSRYALAVPTKDQTAATTVRALWSALIQPFGCPERFLTDQGAAFESALMKQLCVMYGCTKSRTSPYHPMGNGACEKFNQTLLALLATIDPGAQPMWHTKLPFLVQAYNNSTHASTGMTPHYVLFGRHARLPVDLLHDVSPPQQSTTLEGWVAVHHRTLLAAYSQVRTHVSRRQAWDEARYNKGARILPLLPGERVLIRNFRRRGQGKLAPRWVPKPFVVVGQAHPDQPVFIIRPEGSEGPSRTIHRNNLRPCPVAMEPQPASPGTPEPPSPTVHVPFGPPGPRALDFLLPPPAPEQAARERPPHPFEGLPGNCLTDLTPGLQDRNPAEPVVTPLVVEQNFLPEEAGVVDPAVIEGGVEPAEAVEPEEDQVPEDEVPEDQVLEDQEDTAPDPRRSRRVNQGLPPLRFRQM